MTDDEIVNHIQQEKSEADYDGTNILSYQREQSTRAYNGVEFPDGLEPTTGMSSVVINKVQPAVETLTTYLTKLFCSDKETVIFNPTQPDLGPVAKQASMLANHLIHKSNNGYSVLNRMIKDAAVNKNSVVKLYWSDKKTSFTETYENISEEELSVIILQKEEYGYDVEIIEQEQKAVMIEQMDPLTGQAIEVEQMSSKYTIRCTHEIGLPIMENVPPEEFLINNDATSIDRDDNLCRFVCHRKLMYSGDIVSMFPDADVDEILSAHGTDYLEFDYETQNRGSFDGTYSIRGADRGEGALKQIELTESWIKLDVDGKDTLDWYHCFSVGNTLLSKEIWDGPIPFASFCFFPIPNKFYGLSIYDKIGDAYRTITALIRGEIDSTNQRNTFRLIADPKTINHRDLQSGRPGIIKAGQTFDPKQVMQVPVPPGSGGSALQILEYLDRYISSQIGIDPITGAISQEVQVSGNDAAKTSMVVDNASAKVEMYAREFAEMSLRPIIWSMVWMLIEHKDDVSVKKLVEMVTPGMPFLLGEDGMENALSRSDLTAKVGLGHLTQAQRLQGAMAVKQEQAAMKQMGIFIPPQKEAALSYEIAKAAGYENYYDFLPTAEEIAQGNQWMQQALKNAQEQGMQIGAQQAMMQAQTQEIMMKIQKMTAEIQNINAKTQSELTDVEISKREQLLKEREQSLEELVAMNADTTTATALI